MDKSSTHQIRTRLNDNLRQLDAIRSALDACVESTTRTLQLLEEAGHNCICGHPVAGDGTSHSRDTPCYIPPAPPAPHPHDHTLDADCRPGDCPAYDTDSVVYQL